MPASAPRYVGFWNAAYMSGTAEVDRMGRIPDFGYGLTGGSPVRKFMSRMGHEQPN
jgi:hypothetical protein